MKTLDFYDPQPDDELVLPADSRRYSLEHPALSLFTDFQRHEALVLEAAMPLADCRKLMEKSHMSLAMVADKAGHCIGIIGLDDLSDQNIVKKLAEGYSREELQVSDFMRPKSALKAFAYEELTDASIGDVVEALHSSGQQYCLVIERGQHRIRGVISAGELARRLHLPVTVQELPTFVSIFHAIQH